MSESWKAFGLPPAVRSPDAGPAAADPTAAPVWMTGRTQGQRYRADRPGSGPQPHAALPPAPDFGHICEAFLGHARAELCLAVEDGWTSHPALSRLVALGFDPANLADLPVGLFSSHAEVLSALDKCGFSPEQVRASRVLADARLAGRLVGPVLEAPGRICSLWAWDWQARRPRYLYLRRDWSDRVPLVGLVRGSSPLPRDLLVVEDPLEAVYLQSHYFPAAAIGGPMSQISAARWQALASRGVARVMLAPCWARTTAESVWEAVAQADGVTPPLEVFVLGAEVLGTAGAAEFVREQGAEALWELLRHLAVHPQAAIDEVPQAQEPLSRDLPAAPPAETALETTATQLTAIEREPAPLPCPAPAAMDSASRTRTEAIVEPATAEPLAALSVPSPSARPAPPSPALPRGWCELHHCPPTECFCFD